MDIILYNILVGFCSLLLGYIFGSIPVGVIVCKVFFHKDPRLEGSKNSGGTNVGRLFGKRAGVFVIALDMIKSISPMFIVWAIVTFSSLNEVMMTSFNADFGLWNSGAGIGVLYIYLAGLGTAIGHCFPIFSHFKGGKAVATYSGLICISSWWMLVLEVISFFIPLKLTKYVSLSSIIASITTCVGAWVLYILAIFKGQNIADMAMWGWGYLFHAGWEFASMATLIMVLVIIRHHTNIKRLKNKTENKIKWMK